MATSNQRMMLNRNCKGSLRTRLATILYHTTCWAQWVCSFISCLLSVKSCNIERYCCSEDEQAGMHNQKHCFLRAQAWNHNPHNCSKSLVEHGIYLYYDRNKIVSKWLAIYDYTDRYSGWLAITTLLSLPFASFATIAVIGFTRRFRRASRKTTVCWC